MSKRSPIVAALAAIFLVASPATAATDGADLPSETLAQSILMLAGAECPTEDAMLAAIATASEGFELSVVVDALEIIGARTTLCASAVAALDVAKEAAQTVLATNTEAEQDTAPQQRQFYLVGYGPPGGSRGSSYTQ